MRDIVTIALLGVGGVFTLLAAIGVARMPDLFTRMQPATKGTTLGVGSLLLAVAIHFGELAVAARAIAGVVFVLLTAPVAAHMIARAAYFVSVPLWEGTVANELRGRYEPGTHRLSSPPPEK